MLMYKLDYCTIKINQRQSFIFVSRIDKDTSLDEVKSFLNETLSPLNIKFANLEQARLKHDDWLGFTFSVDFQHKDIYKNKSVWPAGLYVDIHKKPRNKRDNVATSFHMDTASSSNNQSKSN